MWKLNAWRAALLVTLSGITTSVNYHEAQMMIKLITAAMLAITIRAIACERRPDELVASFMLHPPTIQPMRGIKSERMTKRIMRPTFQLGFRPPGGGKPECALLEVAQPHLMQTTA
jgi:hypothetical protein